MQLKTSGFWKGTFTTPPSLGRFFLWWLAELGDLFRDGFRKSNAGPELLLLDLDAGFFWLDNQEHRCELTGWKATSSAENLAELLRKTLGNKKPLRLALTHDNFMETNVSVPMAARNNLTNFMKYELDRHFPVSPDHLITTFEYLGENRQTSEIDLKITACLKRDFDFAGQLARHLDCELIYVGRGLDNLEQGNLIGGQRPRGKNDRTWLKGLALLLLLVMTTGILQFKTTTQLNLLQEEFDKLQVRANSERSAIAAIRNNLSWVSKLTTEQPAFLDGLEIIVLSLGDGGTLNYIMWEPNSIEWNGETQDTSLMIEKLASSGVISAIEYLSPVQQDEQVGVENFHLKALLNNPEDEFNDPR